MPVPQRDAGVDPVIMGILLTVKILVELTAPHGPVASVVKVRVIVP